MKKLNLFSMMCLMALPLFIGCEKTENGDPTNTSVVHKFEYNKNMKFRRAGTTDYMSPDVFKNDTLPALIRNQNSTFVLDVVECGQFLSFSDMESRAEFVEDLCDKAPDKIHAGDIPIEIRQNTYTDNVKRAFEEKLGARVIIR